MEIELKLKFMAKDGAKRFLEDDELMKRALNLEKIDIKAEYLDTEDGVLRKNNLALRKRKEGSKLFATIKSKGTQEEGLSTREEYNIEINQNFNDFINEFSKMPIGRKIERLIEDKELKTVVKTNYTRTRFNLKLFDCTAEIAVDNGEIIAGNKSVPINEVEIEYISGDKEGIIKIGEFFKARHALSAETRSKFDRGIYLI